MKVTAKSIPYATGLVIALVVAIVISLISRMPSRFLFSLLFGALAFLVFLLIQGDFELSDSKPLKNKFSFPLALSRDVFVVIVYAISLVIVVLVPSFLDKQFVNWLTILPANYIRLLAGLLLSSILPGYGLLKLTDRKQRFEGLASVVFSFFISVFIMALSSFLSIVANLPIDNIYWITLIINFIIFLSFSINTIKKNMIITVKTSQSSKNYRLDYLIIGCILTFFVIGWVVYYSSYQLGSTGDMWDHYYTFLNVSKGGLLSSSHLSYLGAETWFSLHYLATFELTGFPSLNGWMIYAFINFFYVLAFYLMVRELVGDKYPRVPAIATVIATLFAGFGWVEALSLASKYDWLTALSNAGNYAYGDIIYSFLYGPIPLFFSLAVMFSLIYLMVRKGKFDILSGFLTIALIVQGFLVHSPEIILFPLFYYCYLLFVQREEFGRLKNFSFSILFGLLIIFAIGLPFPSNFYWDSEQSLILLFLAVSATFVLMLLRTRINYHFNFPRRLAILLLSAVWVLYALSFLVWNSFWISQVDQGVTYNLGVVGLKPWYLYPISSGMSLLLGLLGLTSLVVWRKFNSKNMKFLFLALFAFFIVGKIISYVNINFFLVGYWEKRFYSFMVIPLSILCAFFVAEVVSKFSFPKVAKKYKMPWGKHLFVGLFVAIVIISGVASNVLALDRVYLVAQNDPLASYSNAELQALDFLRVNASAGSTVLGLSYNSTLSPNSNRLAYVFSGANHVTSPYWITNRSFQFIDITNPELALKILYSLDVTYLFETKDDLETLQSSGYIADHLLKYLPTAFNNSEVTIYQVPKLNPPSSDSNLTLAVPSSVFENLSDSTFRATANQTLYFPIDMLAESQFDYSIKITGDGSLFNSKYIILSSDKNLTNEQITQYLAWANHGGTLVVFNGDGLGEFAEQLSIRSSSNESLLVNHAIGNSAIIDLGTLNATTLSSIDHKVKTEANYVSRNNQSVPLAFSKQVGEGEILYVNVSPLFNNLNSSNGTLSINFQKMGSLLDLLGLVTPAFKDIPDDKRWEYLGYDMTSIVNYAQLEDSVNIESNSTILLCNQFNVSNLQLANVTGVINGSPIHGSITLQNVNISGLSEKGSVHSIIESTEVNMTSTDYGSYSYLLLGAGSNISLQAPQEGIAFTAISSKNEIYKISLDSGVLSLENTTASNAMARNPSVSINGITSFPEAYFPSYIPNAVGERQLYGSVHFKFDCSSDNIIALTNFSFSGQPENSTKISMFYWEITAIPWASLLTSSLFILSAAVVIFILFIIVLVSRIQRKNSFEIKENQ